MSLSKCGDESGITPSETALVINTLSRITSYISIQGVIGAGKSTFLSRLQYHIVSSGTCAQRCTDLTRPDYYLIVGEPVDEWTSVRCSTRCVGEEAGEGTAPDDTLLGIFYSDKKRWALPFQVYAFTSRIRRLMDALKTINPLIPATARIHIVAERSMRTDCLFFRNLYDSGMVTDFEWYAYRYFFDLVCSDIVARETHMIYIDTAPSKCFERIKRRDRKEETDHAADSTQDSDFRAYLCSLDEQHRRMVETFRAEKGEDSVFYINGNEEITTHEKWDSIVADFRVAIAA